MSPDTATEKWRKIYRPQSDLRESPLLLHGDRGKVTVFVSPEVELQLSGSFRKCAGEFAARVVSPKMESTIASPPNGPEKKARRMAVAARLAVLSAIGRRLISTVMIGFPAAATDRIRPFWRPVRWSPFGTRRGSRLHHSVGFYTRRIETCGFKFRNKNVDDKKCDEINRARDDKHRDITSGEL
jgi:hypothetical protein